MNHAHSAYVSLDFYFKNAYFIATNNLFMFLPTIYFGNQINEKFILKGSDKISSLVVELFDDFWYTKE